jgi:1-deoxy-D-xylulose-5-phosphate synthase
MVICQPRNGQVMKELLESAFSWNRPTALRYPNLATDESDKPLQKRELGTGEVLSRGSDLLIIALGHMCQMALQVKERLKSAGVDATVVDPVFVKPLDSDLFCSLLLNHRFVVTIEEHSLNGGLGMIFNSFLVRSGFTAHQVLNFGIPDTFLEQGTHTEILNEIGLNPEAISSKILNEFNLSSLSLTQVSKN